MMLVAWTSLFLLGWASGMDTVFRFEAEQDLASSVGNVQITLCPGNKTGCPDEATCCKMKTGKYGCCPRPKAVCCSDHQHCCPNGYTCDLKGKTPKCQKGKHVITALQKTAGITMRQSEPALQDTTCPGGKSKCSSTQTCCMLPSGVYGCCDHPKAVCCSDKVHCCPNDYTCDLKQSVCKKGSEFLPLVKKTEAVAVEEEEVTSVQGSQNAIVLCPGKKTGCPEGATCCMMVSGEYGCCSFEKAVCCKDKIHCCPGGYSCDFPGLNAKASCKKGSLTISAAKKSTGITILPSVQDLNGISCPGGKSKCPSGWTCCLMKDGTYGCCQHPKATCCSDKTHCCPEDYTCNLKQGTCKKGFDTVPLLKKVPAVSVETSELQDTTCPGGKSKCPSDNTCCVMKDGSYGCCKRPEAVCCSDHLHCCPKDYTCHMEQGLCKKGKEIAPMLMKVPAMSVETPELKDITCPGGKSKCPDGSTCCILADNTYGCCKRPEAVCCSDKLHCCPKYFTCHMEHKICSRGNEIAPMLMKVPAMSIETPELKDITCPGGKSKCPAGNTCCMLGDNTYGCCKRPEAVCCSDHLHCCPKGYTCHVDQGVCKKEKGFDIIPLLKKTEAIPV